MPIPTLFAIHQKTTATAKFVQLNVKSAATAIA
jgi:hypothetical protein